MDITTGLIAWASYWLGYVTFAGMLPGDRISPGRKRAIAVVVFRNCIATFILSAVVSKIFERVPPIPLHWYFAWPLSYLIMDGVFYCFHRALHWPSLYQWHKQHHSVNFAYPAAALYCSNLEAATDMISHTIGPLLFGFGRVEICIWSALIAVHSLVLHSSLEPRYHLSHHIRQNCNYGITVIFDWAAGTRYTPRTLREMCAGASLCNTYLKEHTPNNIENVPTRCYELFNRRDRELREDNARDTFTDLVDIARGSDI